MTIDDLAPSQRERILGGLSSPTPTGVELRRVARALRLPISEVARRAGITYDRTERLLNGRAKARAHEIAAIGRALGVPDGVNR